jgi:hypothetical protein
MVLMTVDRALTKKELADFRRAWKADRSPFISLIIGDTRAMTVRYRGAINRFDFERPNVFYAFGPTSPSDCLWMVPQ